MIGAMRSIARAWTVCVVAVLGCGTTQTGGEGAGETTAMSSSVGSDSTTGESEGEGEEPMDCGTVTLTLFYTPPVVMYVVDTSASMLTLWDHDGDPQTPPQSRWATARELVGLTASLIDSPFGDPVVGLQRFPSADACPSCTDASACSVAAAPEVALAQQDGAALLAALPGPNPTPVELPGASPAAAAYAHALVELVLAPHESWKYVFLLTDGRTNCGDDLQPPANLGVHDEDLLELVETALFEHDIRTLVIAIDETADPELETGVDRIPGFDPRPALHELGLAGGLAPFQSEFAYFSASDPDRIALLLDSHEDTPTCVIDLSQTEAGPPTAEQIPLVTWTIDGEPIPYVEPDACESADGWTWLVANGLPPGVVMTFCGQPCEVMKMGGVTIEGRYGCPPSN